MPTNPDFAHWELYDNLPLPCLVVDKDMVIIYVNDAYLQAANTKRDQLTGRPYFESLNTDRKSSESVQSIFDNAFKNNIIQELTFTVGLDKTKPANLKNWTIKNIPFPEKGENILYIIQFFQLCEMATSDIETLTSASPDMLRTVEDNTRFLADITRNIVDPIITTDKDFAITRWYPAAQKMFGWREEEAIGRTTFEILKAQISMEERTGILAELADKGYWQGEITYSNKEGELMNGLATVSHLKDARGNVTGHLLLIKDVTKRRKAEKALEELNLDLEKKVSERTQEIFLYEKKYRSLFENNPLPMWVIDQVSFRFLAVNKMAVLQYGFTEKEFLSMNALDIRPHDEKEHFLDSDHTIQTTTKNYNKGTWRHQKKNGDIISVEIIAHDLIFENLPAKMILANDITDRLKASELLSAREEFFRSIIENSAEGISVVNEKYENIYRSPAAEKIAVTTDTESPLQKIHPHDKANMDAKTVQLFKMPGIPVPFLARFKNGIGNYIWLEGTFTNLLHVEGVKGIVTNFRNVSARIATEEKLAASEQQFRGTLNNMMEGAQIIGFDWEYKFVNDTLVTSSKYSGEELLDHNIMERYPGIEKTALFEVMESVMLKRKPQQIENEFVFPDGTVGIFQLSIQPVPEGIFVLSIDITASKNAATVLEKSREHIENIFERISDAFIGLDKDWNYIYVNKAAGIMLKRDPAEMIGKNVFAEYPELRDHSLNEAFLKAMELQQPIQVEEYYEPLDLWLQTGIYPSTEGLSLFLSDISQRKKASMQLMEIQQNLQAIFNNTSEGFILTDINGIVKLFNDKATSSILLGLTNDIAIGKTIFELVESDRTRFFAQVMKDVLGGKTIQYDKKYTLPNGQTTWINLVINPVYMDAGIEGVCITGRDVTEQKTAEEKLQRSFAENLSLADRLSAIINTLPANIALLNGEGIIIEVNESWYHFDADGFKGKDFSVGANYVEVATGYPGLQEDNLNMATGVIKVLTGQADEFTYEYASVAAGEEHWYRMMVTPLIKMTDKGVVIMHMDISELRRLEEERIQQQIQQQQKITHAILRGQEKERNHIGRELHDNINQILAGTRMYLAIAGSKDVEVKKAIAYPLELLDESIQEIRNLCSNMVMPLQDIQLKEMIRDLLQKLSKDQIDCNFKYSVPPETLSHEIKLNLFRIIQEITQNIMKYAEASFLTLNIWTDELMLRMTATDNGKGFDTRAKKQGIGISNMRYRVKSFNGSFNIESTPGTGTTIQIIIPIAKEGATIKE